MELSYWKNQDVEPKIEYVDDKDTVEMFVDAVNNSEELEEKVIKNEPIVSFTLDLEADEYKQYHLWVTENGEGYIQQLYPDGKSIFKLQDNSIDKLKEFFEGKEDFGFIPTTIEFESND